MVLLDTTVLSNFAHIERVDLLRLVLPDAATTPQVVAEFAEGIASGRVPKCNLAWLDVVNLTPLEERIFLRTRMVLGDGEAFRIAVASERKASLFSDDLDARRYARRHGVPVSGTLGVFSLLVSRQHLSVKEADECLQGMIAHGYRSPIGSAAELT